MRGARNSPYMAVSSAISWSGANPASSPRYLALAQRGECCFMRRERLFRAAVEDQRLRLPDHRRDCHDAAIEIVGAVPGRPCRHLAGLRLACRWRGSPAFARKAPARRTECFVDRVVDEQASNDQPARLDGLLDAFAAATAPFATSASALAGERFQTVTLRPRLQEGFRQCEAHGAEADNGYISHCSPPFQFRVCSLPPLPSPWGSLRQRFFRRPPTFERDDSD